ncbi:MAG: hypothetical protein ABL874_01400 [Sphingopyxis sp.]
MMVDQPALERDLDVYKPEGTSLRDISIGLLLFSGLIGGGVALARTMPEGYGVYLDLIGITLYFVGLLRSSVAVLRRIKPSHVHEAGFLESFEFNAERVSAIATIAGCLMFGILMLWAVIVQHLNPSH